MLRNATITTLKILHCEEIDFVVPLLQGLASPFSLSTMTTLVFRMGGDEDSHIVDALRQYLQSPSATIRCLHLEQDSRVHPHRSRLTTILQGLAANVLLEEISFDGCRIVKASEYLLATCVQNKPKLSTLRFRRCNFGHFKPFVEAMVEILTRRGSALRHLKIDVEYFFDLSQDTYSRLVNAIAQSKHLEHLMIGKTFAYSERGLLPILVKSIPIMKVQTFSFDFGKEVETELLTAFKTNFIATSVQFTGDGLTEANQSCLESYLFRNRRLAEWLENPSLIPSKLLPEAIALVQKVGGEALFLTLRALLAGNMGPKQRGREHNRLLLTNSK